MHLTIKNVVYSLMGICFIAATQAQDPAPSNPIKLQSLCDSIYNALNLMSQIEQSPDLELIKTLNESFQIDPIRGEFETSSEFGNRLSEFYNSRRNMFMTSYFNKLKKLEDLEMELRNRLLDITSKKFILDCKVGQVRYDPDKEILSFTAIVPIPPFKFGIAVNPSFFITRSLAPTTTALLRERDYKQCKAIIHYLVDSLNRMFVSVDQISFIGQQGEMFSQEISTKIPFPTQMEFVETNRYEPEFAPQDVSMGFKGDTIGIKGIEEATQKSKAVILDLKEEKILATLPVNLETQNVWLRAIAPQNQVAVLSIANELIGWKWNNSVNFVRISLINPIERISISPSNSILAYHYTVFGEYVYGGYNKEELWIANINDLTIKKTQIGHAHRGVEMIDFLPGEESLLFHIENGLAELTDLTNMKSHEIWYDQESLFFSLDRTLFHDSKISKWFPLTPQIASSYFKCESPFDGLRWDYRYSRPSNLYDARTMNKVFSKTDEEILELSGNFQVIAKYLPFSIYERRDRSITFFQRVNWNLLDYFLGKKYMYQTPHLLSKREIEWFRIPSLQAYVYDIDGNGLGDVIYINSNGSVEIYERDTGITLGTIELSMKNSPILIPLKEANGRWTMVVQQPSTILGAFTSYHFIVGEPLTNSIKIVSIPLDPGTITYMIDFDNDGQEEIVSNVNPESFYTGKPTGKNIKIYQWQKLSLIDKTETYLKYISKKK